MHRFFAPFLVCVPLPAFAHPHIFVDTGFEVIVNEQMQLTHIRISWTYDDLFSLLIAEDMEIDQDGDGALSDKETALLTGFDMNWDAGYPGDTAATLGGRALELSRPQSFTAEMTEGRITSTHVRAVSGTPTLVGALEVKPFDPTYYTAYDVTRPIRLTGLDDCNYDLELPNLDTGLAALQAELAQLDVSANVSEAGFPEVGEKFATTLRVTCPAD